MKLSRSRWFYRYWDWMQRMNWPQTFTNVMHRDSFLFIKLVSILGQSKKKKKKIARLCINNQIVWCTLISQMCVFSTVSQQTKHTSPGYIHSKPWLTNTSFGLCQIWNENTGVYEYRSILWGQFSNNYKICINILALLLQMFFKHFLCDINFLQPLNIKILSLWLSIPVKKQTRYISTQEINKIHTP